MKTRRRIRQSMKHLLRDGAMIALWFPGVLVGQLQVQNHAPPSVVFGGGPRQLSLLVRNPASEPVDAVARWQLVQASSSTAVPWGAPQIWKSLRVLPGQTVLESATVTFPDVRAPTRFLAIWGGTNGARFGTTEVLVCPTNVLSELKLLTGGKAIGVLDPQNRLKPLLRGLSVDFEDLEQRELEFFDGPLAILGPFNTAQEMPPNLGDSVRARVRAGTAVVWIEPPDGAADRPAIEPLSYLICAEHAGAVVAHPGALGGVQENPRAQLNLVRFARLALKVDRLDFPKLKP